jgi:hypothetical protein
VREDPGGSAAAGENCAASFVVAELSGETVLFFFAGEVVGALATAVVAGVL